MSEVAAVGGFEKQYQVDLDPAQLQAYGIPITRVMSAIQNANADVGAMVMELSEREYMVRGLGYLNSMADIENVVVGATASGTPIRVAELGRVAHRSRRAARHRRAGWARRRGRRDRDHALRRERARNHHKVKAKLARDPERRCRRASSSRRCTTGAT